MHSLNASTEIVPRFTAWYSMLSKTFPATIRPTTFATRSEERSEVVIPSVLVHVCGRSKPDGAVMHRAHAWGLCKPVERYQISISWVDASRWNSLQHAVCLSADLVQTNRGHRSYPVMLTGVVSWWSCHCSVARSYFVVVRLLVPPSAILLHKALAPGLVPFAVSLVPACLRICIEHL